MAYRRVSKTQQKLTNKLYFLVFLIVTIIGGVAFSLIRYGPEIGYLLGFVSKHRNEDPNKWLSVQPPIFTYLPEAVNENKVTIEGSALPTTTVKLYLNGPETARVITDLEGKFLFPDIELIDGKNTIFAKAVGKGNVESSKSEILYITVDKEDPEIEVIDPKPDSVVRNLNKTVLISGKVNEKATITINGRSARIKPDLSFELLVGVSEGNNSVEIIAMDLAGNETDKSYSFKYEKRAE